MIGPEEWREITWFIYDDGSYNIISEDRKVYELN